MKSLAFKLEAWYCLHCHFQTEQRISDRVSL